MPSFALITKEKIFNAGDSSLIQTVVAETKYRLESGEQKLRLIFQIPFVGNRSVLSQTILALFNSHQLNSTENSVFGICVKTALGTSNLRKAVELLKQHGYLTEAFATKICENYPNPRSRSVASVINLSTGLVFPLNLSGLAIATPAAPERLPAVEQPYIPLEPISTETSVDDAGEDPHLGDFIGDTTIPAETFVHTNEVSPMRRMQEESRTNQQAPAQSNCDEEDSRFFFGQEALQTLFPVSLVFPRPFHFERRLFLRQQPIVPTTSFFKPEEKNSTKTKPKEALNGTQKNIIEGTLVFYFDDIKARFNPNDAIRILKGMKQVEFSTETRTPLSEEFCSQEIQFFTDVNVLDSVNFVHSILIHAFPETLLNLNTRSDVVTPRADKEAVVGYIHLLIDNEIREQEEKLVPSLKI